jgi:hypothetical protein
MAGQALTAEMIQALLAQSKSRGEYDQVLREFLGSGEMGIEVDIHGGPLQGKRAKQVKVGFDNARKKTNDNGLVHPGGKELRVIAITGKVDGPEGKQVDKEDNSEDHVYLINTNLAAGALSEGENTEAAA